jgi:tetratricopeptide (TPR) repeat protein
MSCKGIAKDLDDALSAHRKGRVQEAVAAYREVLRREPLQPVALHLLGVGLAQLEAFAESTTVLARAVELCPSDALIRVHYGNALWGLRRAEEALRSYDRAISLDPSSVDAHCNRGKVLNQVDRPELALESFDRAVALRPDRADAHNNRGTALAALGRDAEALESYDRALELDPTLSGALWNKSLVLLRRGNFRDGWKLHVACPEYQSPNTIRRFPGKPAWDGTQSLAGKTLLLHADQGYGDVIQYCRYAPLLRERGARVILEAPRDLRALMQSLAGIDACTTRSDEAPAFDLQCPFSNLPAAFGTDLKSVPASIPYLRVDEGAKRRWADRLGQRGGPRAGLVWSGNLGHRQDRSRSIPLALLDRLKQTGVEFVSLQKEVRSSDAFAVSLLCSWHFGAELVDFSDTAAVISQLDIVISVDTAVAHLAGALGAPVWILLPFVADWRWMTARNDSPWYPTARFFRQTTRGQWDAPIESVRHALLNLVSKGSHGRPRRS